MNAKRESAAELYRQARYEEADQLIAQELAEGETSDLWNDWGAVQLARGRQDKAETGFRHALELDPDSDESATNLGLVLFNLGKLEEAARFLRQGYEAANGRREKISKLLAQCEAARATISEFMDNIARLPGVDSTLPTHLKQALARRAFDSSFYVKGCVQELRKLPRKLWPLAIAAVQQASPRDYRLGLVAALYHLEAGEPSLALPLVNAACNVNTDDLYAEDLLIEAESAIARAEGRSHPTFSGLREWLAESSCGHPWRHLELTTTGDVYLCCPGWLPVPVGHIKDQSGLELWNSAMAQELRQSVDDGSFKYCSKIQCPFIAMRKLPKRGAQPAVALPTEESRANSEYRPPSSGIIATTGPSKLVLTYDRTCNLACPICRPDFIVANKAEQQEIEQIHDRFLADVLDDARLLVLDGAGEVFVSKPSRRLLKRLTRSRYPNLRFALPTNGLLFNQRTFDEFDLRGRIYNLNISIDAATEATYRIVRRGGDFSRLIANFAFLDEMRQREGKHFGFHFVFVVWAANFREMVDLIRLGKRFRVDSIFFSLIRKQGHDDQQFDEMNVANPRHPQHQEFLEVLRAPEFDEPNIWLGSVAQFRQSPVRSPRT